MSDQLPMQKVSPWVEKHVGRIAADGHVLDLACGSGRHARYLVELGYSLYATDIDLDQVADLRGTPRLELRQADLEQTSWPLEGLRFDGIVVCNYLHRPHLPRLADCLANDGILIYETFAAGNEQYGKPSRPDYLLQPGELLDVFADELRVIEFEQGLVHEPNAKVIQRICAVRDSGIKGE